MEGASFSQRKTDCRPRLEREKREEGERGGEREREREREREKRVLKIYIPSFVLSQVMEVLKESLEPSIMGAKISWHPPPGYSVADSTSLSLGTMHSHQTHLAFAFLRKTSRGDDKEDTPTKPPAVISGSLQGQEVEVRILEAALPPLSPEQSSELAAILAQVGRWSMLEDLEIERLVSVSRKNSTEEEDREGEEEKAEDKTCEPPRAKRRRMNGEQVHSVTAGSAIARQQRRQAADIQKELLQLSMESGIPCPFTFLKGTASDG